MLPLDSKSLLLGMCTLSCLPNELTVAGGQAGVGGMNAPDASAGTSSMVTGGSSGGPDGGFGGVSGAGTQGGAAGSVALGGEAGDGGAAGNGEVANCNENVATELEFSIQVDAPNDGCVKVTNYPTWWGVRNMRLDSPPGSGTFPVPFEWRSDCQDASGTGVLEQPWGSSVFGLTDASCATVIDLRGSGDGTVGLMYFDVGS